MAYIMLINLFPIIIRILSPQQVNAHDSLVFSILGEMLAYPDNELTRYLSRTLRHLHLTSENYSNLRQVSALTAKVITVLLNLLGLFTHFYSLIITSAYCLECLYMSNNLLILNDGGGQAQICLNP